MRILVCNWRDLTHPDAGGAEVYTEEVMRRWAAQGHQVTLFSAAVAGQPGDAIVHGIRHVRRGSRFSVYREAARWYQQTGRGQFDLVIDETNTRPFFCHEWVDDAAVVALFHQTAEEIWFHQMSWMAAAVGRYVLEPKWLRRYTRVPTLTVSQSSKESLEAFGLRDITVVPEGLDLPANLPQVPKEEVPTLVHVGRLVTNKQPQHVLAAFAEVRKRLPDAQLWMIGTGPLEDELRRMAPAGVTFLGRVSQEEKFDRMARAHAHVMASVREGWGLVVAEAAAVGTRTIAYDRPGLRDAVRAADGLLVPPNPEALASWIGQVLPRWMATPPPAVQDGGVLPWIQVADIVLDTAVEVASLSAAARQGILTLPTMNLPADVAVAA